jgi:transcriptional regulator with XRE-family HTH domain
MTAAPDERNVGATVREVRLAQKLTLRQLAHVAGVTHTYLSELERGRFKNPRRPTLDAIARGLGFQNAEQLLSPDRQQFLNSSRSALERSLRALVGPPPWRDSQGQRLEPSSSVEAKRALESYDLRLRRELRRELDPGLRLRIRDEIEGAITEFVTEEVMSDRTDSAWVEAGLDFMRRSEITSLATADTPHVPPAVPVYRSDSIGDPMNPENLPSPDHFEPAPSGKESLIGQRGFGILITTADWGKDGLMVGDILWVNPDIEPHSGRSSVVRMTLHGRDVGFGLMGFGTGQDEPDSTLTYGLPAGLSMTEALEIAHEPVGAIMLVSRSLPPDVWLDRETGRLPRLVTRVGGFDIPEGATWRAATDDDVPEFIRRSLLEHGGREPRLTITFGGRVYQFRQGQLMILKSQPFVPNVEVVGPLEARPAPGREAVADRVAKSLLAAWPDLPDDEQEYILQMIDERRRLRERVVTAESPPRELTGKIQNALDSLGDRPPTGGASQLAPREGPLPPVVRPRRAQYEDAFGSDDKPPA